MTNSLAERARNRRKILLNIRKLGADSGVVMDLTSAQDADGFFSSTRSNPMTTLFMAA